MKTREKREIIKHLKKDVARLQRESLSIECILRELEADLKKTDKKVYK